jgi:hypothetical protein
MDLIKNMAICLGRVTDRDRLAECKSVNRMWKYSHTRFSMS